MSAANERSVNALVRQFHPANQTRCSYKCPFYQNGAVHSWCRQYGRAPRYDGNIPPLRVAECVSDTSNVRIDGQKEATWQNRK
jgi:hypothetical protein